MTGSTGANRGVVFMLVICLGIGGLACSGCYGRTTGEAMAAIRKALEHDPLPSASERVDACVRLLEEEMRSPSVPGIGGGGGPIDSGYVQSVIMGSVCTFAQKGSERDDIRSSLVKRLASTPNSDTAMRDRLTVMIGQTGDRTVIPQLIAILGAHPEGYMRFSAAMSLREMAECREAIPALLRAMRTDHYTRVRSDDISRRYDSVTMVYSPVRSVAAEILQRHGVAVPKRADVVPARYGVDRMEALLYSEADQECRSAAIDVLEWIGGIEARTALQRFVRGSAGRSEMKPLVDKAKAALARMSASK